MPRYLIRPKDPVASRSVSLAARVLTATARKQQWNDLVEIRLADPVDQNIRRWVSEEAKSNGVKPLAHGAEVTPITSTTIVEMSESEAQRLAREIPQAVSLRDQ